MRLTGLWIPVLVVFAGCTTLPAAAPAGARADAAAVEAQAAAITALADEYLAGLLQQSPETGTFLGLPFADHAGITDNTFTALRAWEAREDAWLARLGQLRPEAVRGRPEFITYGFVREQLESSIQGRVCRRELWRLNQLFGWQTMYPFLATLQPVGTAEHRRDALQRFSAIPRFVEIEIENLRAGAQQGYTAPRVNVERVVEQLDRLLATPAAESPWMVLAQRDGSAEFRDELESVVDQQINPALRRFNEYLRSEYLPVARIAVGVAALPDGEACYRSTVRGFVTLDVPPREIHEVGLREMQKIQAEMHEIAQRSFGTSDVPALLQRFKTDPQYTFSTREEIVAYAQQAVDRSRDALSEWFGILPRADLRIEQYAEFEERSAPAASYLRPAEDGSRPAIYRINTYQPERQSKVGIESTAFHEAIPGHHLQIAIAQERPGAHPVTRFLGNSGFSEGWALYAERLADEMGLFGSDLDRMGMLSNEAFRAARLVVDPGIHVLGWTREQAIDYMVAHTAESRDQIATEVDRYIIMPGQATAYMIGSLEIQRLRSLAERDLGPRFDIRAFHDRVLEDGSVTLPMLRDKIERWIAESR